MGVRAPGRTRVIAFPLIRASELKVATAIRHPLDDLNQMGAIGGVEVERVERLMKISR